MRPAIERPANALLRDGDTVLIKGYERAAEILAREAGYRRRWPMNRASPDEARGAP